MLLVQEKQNIDRYISSAWIVSIARGVFMSIVLLGLAPFIAQFFNCKVMVLLPRDAELEIYARANTKQNLDDKSRGIAKWVFELGQMAGLGTDTLSYAKALYMPLLGTNGVIGVLSIKPLDKEQFTTNENLECL